MSGQAVTGLLVKRDVSAVMLRDAQYQEIMLAANIVDELRPSRASLMPEGQLAGPTAREAAEMFGTFATRR